MKISMHNHTILSDGKNTPEELIGTAIERDFSHIAITDHVSTLDYEEHSLDPKKYDLYIEKIRSLAEKYKDKIQVAVGMESEYYMEKGVYVSDLSNVRDKLDFIVGSVHAVYKNEKPYAVDELCSSFRKVLTDVYNEDINQLVEDYFTNYNLMLLDLKPEIAGHIDLIKKNNIDNIFFDEYSNWFKDLIENTLDNIKEIDAIMEINTGGASKHGLRCMYPSEYILSRAYKKGIKVTMGSDAHTLEMLDCLYETGLQRLRRAGYKEIYTFDTNRKEFIPIEI